MNAAGWMRLDGNLVPGKAGMVNKSLEVTSAKSNHVSMYVHAVCMSVRDSYTHRET